MTRAAELRVSNLQFVHEQDGAPERLLKDRLVQSFNRRADVQRAYLAQVNAGGQLGVALCLRSLRGPDRGLVDDISDIFAAVFAAHEHLDVLFLNDDQESVLRSVCAPFFTAPMEPPIA